MVRKSIEDLTALRAEFFLGQHRTIMLAFAAANSSLAEVIQ